MLLRWLFCPYNGTVPVLQSDHKISKTGGKHMKGYIVGSGYMGYINGRYYLFANEADYREYMED